MKLDDSRRSDNVEDDRGSGFGGRGTGIGIVGTLVILVNLGSEPFVVTRGMRIAQLVVAPVARADVTEVAMLEDTARGAGGFGSTGG